MSISSAPEVRNFSGAIQFAAAGIKNIKIHSGRYPTAPFFSEKFALFKSYSCGYTAYQQ